MDIDSLSTLRLILVIGSSSKASFPLCITSRTPQGSASRRNADSKRRRGQGLAWIRPRKHAFQQQTAHELGPGSKQEGS